MGTFGKRPTHLLSHLIFGIEAQALKACLDLEPGSIVLLQHDGFTSTKKLHVPALEQTLLSATGLILKLEEEQVSPKFSALQKMVDDLSFPKGGNEDCSMQTRTWN
jgi:hypothetical protein